jgi:hypothetical protein
MYPDIRITNHGSIVILTGLTKDGSWWLDNRLDPATQRWAGGYVVEPRYVDDILEGAWEEGLGVL